jgi:hypothetical protein
MAYRWPAGTVFKRIDLDVEERSCPVCDRDMHVCDHRYHHLWTLAGPTQVVNRLVRCPDPTCDSRGQTFSPEAELSISMPRWCMGWDVLCWLGHRRFARHWSVPQLRAEFWEHQAAYWQDRALMSGDTHWSVAEVEKITREVLRTIVRRAYESLDASGAPNPTVHDLCRALLAQADDMQLDIFLEEELLELDKASSTVAARERGEQ